MITSAQSSSPFTVPSSTDSIPVRPLFTLLYIARLTDATASPGSSSRMYFTMQERAMSSQSTSVSSPSSPLPGAMKYLWSSTAITMTSPLRLFLYPMPYLLPTSCAMRKASWFSTLPTMMSTFCTPHSSFSFCRYRLAESFCAFPTNPSGSETYCVESLRNGIGTFCALHSLLAASDNTLKATPMKSKKYLLKPIISLFLCKNT